ncbi:uncharacterized protein PRCAT00002171001 [Priceomyces carsonii]|uniref:uncharacterized protein n=1 Tax=Priceomyces carsonii TaxID=28549 RepID=UPI002EDA0E45|nr:unnamed protein product [Priceomyces carsonii]
MTELADKLNPNFKSTLPPRKRAKTKEEKEQRRVERILRNRRAAHASREKKRKHVEYLESYVVQLEENMKCLQQNFDAIVELVPQDKFAGMNLQKLNNLEELKEKIQVNLSSSVAAESSDQQLSTESVTEPPTKKRRSSSTLYDDIDFESSSQLEPKEDSEEPEDADEYQEDETTEKKLPPIKKEHENELLSVTSDNVFFNYLSPISMNSPVGSPIDLTLKKSSDQLTPFELDEESGSSSSISSESNDSEKGYESMEQNSEEILLSKGYGVGASVAIC